MCGGRQGPRRLTSTRCRVPASASIRHATRSSRARSASGARQQVLLLRLGADRGEWAGRLNGIGGHIEPGEDVLTSARREIREEAGLSPGDLRLCGVVMIDVGPPGIGLFVLVGTAQGRPAPRGGLEGRPGGSTSAAWVEQATGRGPSGTPAASTGSLRRRQCLLRRRYHYDETAGCASRSLTCRLRPRRHFPTARFRPQNSPSPTAQRSPPAAVRQLPGRRKQA